MRRRHALVALAVVPLAAAAPLVALASSPDQAKKKDPPPEPKKKLEPKKGDKSAGEAPDDTNLTPKGEQYKWPKQK